METIYRVEPADLDVGSFGDDLFDAGSVQVESIVASAEREGSICLRLIATNAGYFTG